MRVNVYSGYQQQAKSVSAQYGICDPFANAQLPVSGGDNIPDHHLLDFLNPALNGVRIYAEAGGHLGFTGALAACLGMVVTGAGIVKEIAREKAAEDPQFWPVAHAVSAIDLSASAAAATDSALGLAQDPLGSVETWAFNTSTDLSDPEQAAMVRSQLADTVTKVAEVQEMLTRLTEKPRIRWISKLRKRR